MKDNKNEKGARVLDVPPPGENDHPSGRWSIEERDQLLLREREARLEAEVMREANLALTQDLSLERTLETLLDYLRRLVPFDSANVMLVEGDSYFVTSAIRGYEDFLKDPSLAKGTSFSPKTNALLRQICETKQSLLVSDTKDEPRWQSIPGSEHIRNWIGVPLFAHDEIMGLYSLDKAQPGYFTAEHVRKAESLALSAASAIQNAKLFRQVERHSSELEQRIAERKKAEEARREAEQKYRDIFENAGEGISQTTPEGRFIAANPALARMYGFDSPEELISSLSDISQQVYVDPARREEFKSLLKEHGVVRGFEYQIFRKDGSKIWVSVNARAVRDARGAILYYEGTTQDINERKRAEVRSAAFATLARKLSGALTQLEAGRIIAETADDLFGWDSCCLDLYDADRDLIRSMLNVDTIDGKQTDVTALVSDREPTPRSKRVIAHGPELLLREEPIQFDEDAIPFGDKSRPSASIMTVPVRHADRVVGLLSVQSYTVHHYDGAGLADLEALADYCGEALNRIQAEESLSASEERYRELFENAKDVIYVHDLSGRYISVNRAAEKLSGYTREEILGKHYSNFVAPSHLQYVRKNLSEKVDEESETIYEVLVITKDRRRVPVELSSRLIYKNGVVVAVQGTARDITERKQAENALQESEERFRQLSDAAFEAIILHDQGTILEVNQSFCRMYGYERAEVIGKSVLDLVVPEFHELLLQKVRSGDTGPYEGYALRKDGTTFRAEVAGKPIHYQGRVVRVAAIRDITEQERNERRQAAQYAVTRVLAESATLAEATPQLLQVICESLRWKMGEFWRVDDSINLLRCVETWHVPGLEATAFIEASRQTELAPDAGLPGRVWQSGQPAWVSDVTTDPGFARAAIASNLGLRGAAAFPILLGNHTLGLMLFFSRRTPEVDEDLLKIMSAIGSQIGQFTERKRAEEALLESEERLRLALDAAHMGTFDWDVPRNHITWSRWHGELWGFKPGEFDGTYEKFSERVHHDDLPGINAEVARCIAAREPYAREFRVVWRDGSVHWVQGRGDFTFGDDGQPVRMRGAVLDITARKQAEEALRQSEQRYRTLFETAPDGVAVFDLQMKILMTNRRAVEIYGYENSAEMIGLSGLDLIAPQFRARARQNATRILEMGYLAPIESIGVKKDGTQFAVESSAAVIRNAQGKPATVLGITRDITARKRAEAAVKDSEARYRSLFENMAEGCAYCRMLFEDGRPQDFIYLAVNEAFGKLTGLSDVVGKKVSEVIPGVSESAAKFFEVYGRVALTGRPERFKAFLEPLHMWLSVSVYSPAKEHFVAVFENITERQQAEAALWESEERYRDLVENSRELICTHDLDGLILSANPAAAAAVEYDLDEYVGKKTIRDLLAPEVSHQFDEYMARLCKDGATTGIMLVQTKSGERRVWEYYNSLRTEGVAAPIVRGMARDITDRRRAEQALLASERKYHDIFAFAPVGIYQSLRDGTLTTANKALAEMLAYASVDEFLKVNLADVYFTPDEREKLIREYEDPGYAIDLELQWKRKDSSPMWIQLSAHAIKGSNGATEYFEGFVRDITERKRAEEALRESEGFRQTIFDSEPECVKVVGRDFTLLDMNPAGLEMIGASSREQVIGQSVLTVIAPEWRNAFTEMHQRVLRGDSVVAEFETCGLDGVRRWMETHAVPLRNREATVVGQLAITRDITERRRVEEALRESEERYRDLVENSREFICTHDLNGLILSANRAASEVLGYDLKKVCGKKNYRDLLVPEVRDQFDDYLARLRRDGVASGLTLVQTSSGERRILEYHNTVRTEGVAAPIVRGMARDITEKRRAEKAMSDLRRELELTMSSMEEGVHRVDLKGNIVFENPAAARMLGWGIDQLLGQPAHLTMHHTRPDGTPYPTEECQIYATFRDGVSRHVADEVFWRQDGTSFPVEYMTAPMRNERNEIVATVVTFRDITERKRAEDTLRKSEERYRSLFVNMLNGFAYCKVLFEHEQAQDFIYLEVNDAFEKLTGFKDVVGKKVTEIIPGIRESDPELFETYGRVALTGRPETFEIYLASLDTWHAVSLYSPRKGYFVSVFDVITERKRAEAALRESEQELRLFNLATNDMFWKWDFATGRVVRSIGFERAFGYSEHEITPLIGWWEERLHPDDQERVLTAFQTALKRGDKTCSYEYHFCRHDGSYATISDRAYIVRDESGKAVRAMGAMTDITERKRAEEEKEITFHQLGERVKELGALHLAAQIFQDTQKTTSDVLQEIASILPAAWQYPDISAARVTYGGAESTTPNYSDTLWKQSVAFATKDGKQGAIEVVYLEGRPNEVEGPFLAEERNLINTLAYDLTVFLERKHAEKALSESEERYRELFENAKDAIYVHDLGGRYVSVNRAAEQLTGFSREQIVGKHYSNFVSPRDLKQVRTSLCRKLDEENETIYEVNVVNRDGRRIPVEVSSRLIYENGVVAGVQGTARDITERKRAQEALRIYSQRLIQVQEAERENIARELHDEIGQVLTAVRINLQSIQRSRGTDEGVRPLDESIAIVDEALGRVRELSIELRPSLLDDLGLSAALRWYVDRYARRTGIIAEVLDGLKEDGRLPRELETACFRIAQEALTNVARHAQAGSVSVQIERSRERMLLTIIDDGVGFDLDKLRLSASAAAALGLRGMEERALALGGHLEIDSGLERGTRILANFPLKRK